jgi:uncharacterized heparinase superfamily protein
VRLSLPGRPSLGSLARLIAFARHVPPRQLARRARLKVQGAAERRLKPSLAGSRPARLSSRPPLAAFPDACGTAERIESGWRFRFLNRVEETPQTIDWQLGGPGAANQLWRMNLHYFEWSSTLGDGAFVAAVDQWHAAYPPYAPGADQDGWNAYALSLRVVALLKQLALRGNLEPRWGDRTVEALAAQLRYLERHLETDIGGNHLIKNIRALLWGACAIDASDSPRWRRLGLHLLKRELRQILADGMHVERSPSYHAQVLGDLIDIRQALGGDPLDGSLDAAIVSAAQVVADLAHPDGGPALFGDAGLTMAVAPHLLREAARVVSGQMFTARASFDLPHGGYAGLRIGSDLLLVDAGPLGPDALPGHAHGDIGSFEWSVAGARLIIDQGVFTYVAGDQRQASRSARSHNTLAAPGADQGDFFGAFRLGRRCHLAHRAVIAEADRLRVEVAHDGLVGTSGGARHTRSIDARKDEIIIVDRLDRPLAGAAIGFLLAPETIVRETDEAILLWAPTFECRIATDGKATIESAAWWPDMGVEIPTKRIRIALAGTKARTVLTVLSRNES